MHITTLSLPLLEVEPSAVPGASQVPCCRHGKSGLVSRSRHAETDRPRGCARHISWLWENSDPGRSMLYRRPFFARKL